MRNTLFLISSSTVFGKGYLEHVMDALRTFLGDERVIHFAPFALADHNGYTEKVQTALAPLGVTIKGLHAPGLPTQKLEDARVLFVGGGNSFRLLKALQHYNLLDPIRKRVAAGDLLYISASAGTNMACPSLRTTNDMPIVRPGSFEALNLIPFQINPHYLDPQPDSTHMGETREQRIKEFLEENDVPVLGMREGCWLLGGEGSLRLEGLSNARLFARNAAPRELTPGTDLSWLLETVPHFDRRAEKSGTSTPGREFGLR
jgi:dipeptidase E